MKLTSTLLTSALATLALGQTAPHFYITVTTNIGVDYRDSNVTVTPGELLPRIDLLSQPSFHRPAKATTDTAYVGFLVDQDVVRNGTRTALLHWLVPNLYASADHKYLAQDLTHTSASTAVGAPYIPPSPPAGSGAHSYTFVLFEQPDNWAVPASFVTINPPANTQARIGFNITQFIAVSGLSDPVGANYMRVINGTAAETSSAETMTMTMTSATAMASGSSAATTTSAGSTGTTATTATASATTSRAGAVEVRGNVREVAVGLAMGIVGAGLWMM